MTEKRKHYDVVSKSPGSSLHLGHGSLFTITTFYYWHSPNQPPPPLTSESPGSYKDTTPRCWSSAHLVITIFPTGQRYLMLAFDQSVLTYVVSRSTHIIKPGDLNQIKSSNCVGLLRSILSITVDKKRRCPRGIRQRLECFERWFCHFVLKSQSSPCGCERESQRGVGGCGTL